MQSELRLLLKVDEAAAAVEPIDSPGEVTECVEATSDFVPMETWSDRRASLLVVSGVSSPRWGDSWLTEIVPEKISSVRKRMTFCFCLKKEKFYVLLTLIFLKFIYKLKISERLYRKNFWLRY